LGRIELQAHIQTVGGIKNSLRFKVVKFDNKFPGKDVAPDDLITKFPLVAKKDPEHRSEFTLA
jgi:hypothetical protein